MNIRVRSILTLSTSTLLLPALALAVVAGSAQGATLYWDGPNSGGTGNGASDGGSGTWNTTTTKWDAANLAPRVLWVTGSDAVFAGNAGTVTLGTAISAGKISISNSDYTIATASGAGLTLTTGITIGGNYQQITGVGGLALSGAQAFDITGGLRISAAISGSSTITKTGAGMLSFTGANSGFTGKIIVNAGRFGIGADSALGAVPGAFTADSITLNGGTLVDGIVNNASNNFDNGGIFTINANRGITLGGSGGAFQVGYGAAANLTVAGVIAGGALTKSNDDGTLTLNGANTYTGGTTISGGTMAIGNNTALGTAAVAMATGTTLANNSAGALVVANAFNLTGSTTITGSQNLTLSGAISSVGGAITVNKTGASVLTLSTDNSGTIAAGSTWNVTGGTYNSSTGLYNNVLAVNRGQNLGSSSSNVLNLNGGTLRFNADGGAGYSSARTINVQSGGGAIDDGGFAFGEATAGQGSVAPGITIATGGTLSLVSSNKLVLAGTLSGLGAVSKFGTATATLSGNSTYSGGTTIGNGTIVTGARGLGSGVVTVASGGTLSVSQSTNIGLAGQYFNFTPSNVSNVDPDFSSLSALQSHLSGLSQPALALNTTSMNFGTTGSSFPSPYASGGANFESYYSGMLNITTGGTYTFNTSSDDGSVLFVDGTAVVNNNFFQGVTTRTGSIALLAGMHNIAYGFYQGGGGYGFTAQISGAGNTTMADLTTGNAQITPDLVIGSLSGAGSVVLTTGNLILGQDNTNQTFSGVISGIGGVNKWGTAIQTLSGANTYAGTTTIAGGTLNLGANNVIPDGSGKGDVTVLGSLNLNGFADTINGLNGSGTVAAGSTQLTVGNNNANGTFSGVLTSSAGGGLVKTGSGTQTLSGAGDNSGGRAQVNAGTLILAKTNSGSAHAVGSNGNTDYALVISGGTAQLGGTGGDQIYQNSAVNMTGGTFDLAGLSEGFDGLSGNAGTITNSTSSTTSTLTLGQNNSSGSPSFGGIIQNGNGTIGLTKTGSGTQTLSGANTYTGQTSVSAGTLTITAGGISGGTVSQTIIVNDTGTGTATMTQSGGAVSAGTGEIWIGQNSGSTGIYNLSGGTFASASWLAIGRNFATGTLNITGIGALTHTGSNHVTIGSGGGGAGNGTVNQTGGSFTAASEIWLGETGTANYNISGGTVNANGGLRISRGTNPGTLTLQNATGTTGGLANGGGTETFTTTTLLMSESTGASTVNLDGGTLVVTQVASAGGGGSKTLNLGLA